MRVVLTVIAGPHTGREFSFDGHDNFIVGRSKAAQFRLPQKDQHFSRNHFLVEVNPPLCRLLDLNSTNGTLVNGKQVESIELRDGDNIEAGDTTIRVSIHLHSPISGTAQHVTNSNELNRVVGAQTIVPMNWAKPIHAGSARIETKGDAASPGSSVQNTENDQIAATLVPDKPIQQIRQPKKPATAVRLRPTADDICKIASQSQPFDGYEIIEELGRGGMGVVYRARSKSDDTLVAIKVVLPAIAASPEDLSRFVREANIVKDLTHPHIVPFRDLGHTKGKLFFVMDYVQGINGQSLMRQHESSIPVKRAVDIVCQLLEGLSAAHRRGYVHRDVKPGNILIESRSGRDHVWLADFGLARAYQSSKLSGLTTTGNIGGTLPFMAPEQITNFRDVTPAADQYSAAATLFHLLTKRHTYNFPKDVARQILMVLQEPPQPITELRGDISVKLAEVIHKGLARLPSERFADVDIFREALQNCVH